MIVWRGFGVAAFILGLLGLVLGFWLGTTFNDGQASNPLVAIGLIVAAVATFVLGWVLNVTLPDKKAAAWRQERRSELDVHTSIGEVAQQEAVAAGAAPPVATDETADVAAATTQVQNEVALDSEATAVRKQLRNRHTFFWIPMQWWGVVWLALGVLLLAGVIRAA